MTPDDKMGTKGDILLELRDPRHEAQADDVGHGIVRGGNVKLNGGEGLRLIGQSGAGKSTICTATRRVA